MSADPSPTPRRARRILREQELIAATRELWDRRGAQVAGVEEIAKEVGIARGQIYRLFSSKDELFILTVTSYLDELAVELEAAIDLAGGADERLDRALTTYAQYCLRRPAFIDGTLSLMRQPAPELRALVSDAVWWRLGASMGACLSQFASVLADPAFLAEDPRVSANLLWSQMLGALQLARLGVGVGQASDGQPIVFEISAETIVTAAVRSAAATVRRRSASR